MEEAEEEGDMVDTKVVVEDLVGEVEDITTTTTTEVDTTTGTVETTEETTMTTMTGVLHQLMEEDNSTTSLHLASSLVLLHL